MKIRSVHLNNRKKAFEVKTSTRVFSFPFVKADPQPTPRDGLVRVFADEELAREAFTYVLESGREGTVHVEQVLEYNQDPAYLRDLLLYKLTIEAQRRVETSALSKREIIRRLGTSATQFYRLVDQTNYRKSVDQLLSLLHVLDCDVDLVVKTRSVARGKAA
jgi:predicted XRE-type DNA-binding protein